VTLAEKLAGMEPAEREQTLLDLVRAHTAAVLGYDEADAIDPDKGFTDLGVDSLAALELRNRLGAATGLRLPATLVFDYPTALPLTRYLLTELLPAPVEEDPAAAVPEEDALLRERIAGMGVADLLRTVYGEQGGEPA
jgi:acyl carrier protein